MNFNRDPRKVTKNKSQHLNAQIAVGEANVLKEPKLIDNWVIWLEQRPSEGGRTTAFIKPWFASDSKKFELTPSPINVRTRVHGYGGAALSVAKKSSKVLVSWIDDLDGCLWIQSWVEVTVNSGSQKALELKAINSPICLSKQANYLLADGLIDLSRNRWIGILESNESDALVQFSLENQFQNPSTIYSPKDFIGYLTLSPDSKKLAWTEWQCPSMPWDSSELWLGNFDEAGVIDKTELLLGNNENSIQPISIFQPVWLETGEIVVSEDSSGWWNLIISDKKIEFGKRIQWNHICPVKAEFAFPQWLLGMSSIASSSQKLINLICENGSWHMALLTRDGELKLIHQPFNDLASLNAHANKVVAIASNQFNETGLLEIDLNNEHWQHSLAREPVIEKDLISVPQSLWFKGFNNEMTHCWYYPPLNSNNSEAPLLVKSHSGPTGMAQIGLNLEIQFWTSRGWGVVDVNYGGSTGFGRAYRERLKKGWGEVDVFDCAAAAKALIASGKADSKRIAIEGGSAGGFTTLSCLCFTDIFSVGACRYPVTDLISMAKSTHRFEANYLDYLLGPLPENHHIYYQRSPLVNVNKIGCPVIFFQGLKDKVVLPSQTKHMVDALRKNKIPTEVHYYENEGHGFRDSKIKISVLELTEKFFNKNFNL
tara:strand:+ start:264 stop:2228 length:1965 start_codon:yes stop_codon:yes gene_type:complete